MKILVVSKCTTHPANAGNRRFIFNQISLFEKMGHEVHFLYVRENGLFNNNKTEELEILNELNLYWTNRLHIFNVSKFQKIWFNIQQKVLRPYFFNGYAKSSDGYPLFLTDYVISLQKKEHFECCIVNYYYMTKLFDFVKFPIMAVNTHDYFSYKDKLVGINKLQSKTTASEEAIALQRSPVIFALNTEEAIFFSKLSPNSKVYNVFSTFEYHASDIVGNHNILFLSGPNLFNIKGIKWFVENIFPSIKRQFPDSKLLIGGAICDAIPVYSKNENIVLCGRVENADVFYKKADVVINPTYLGTGLKIKTFESISYDKVTMTHPHSSIGIFKPNDAPLFSSEDPEQWVSFLKRIWSDESEIRSIKDRNREYVTEMNTYVEKQYLSAFNICPIKNKFC